MAGRQMDPVIPSGLTDGVQELITTIVTAGALDFHTATAAADTFDEVFLWILSHDSDDVFVTVEIGGTTDPGEVIHQQILKNTGANLVLNGKRLQGGKIVRIFASIANRLAAVGNVNRIGPR